LVLLKLHNELRHSQRDIPSVEEVVHIEAGCLAIPERLKRHADPELKGCALLLVEDGLTDGIGDGLHAVSFSTKRARSITSGSLALARTRRAHS
jgi:hypothetical protein